MLILGQPLEAYCESDQLFFEWLFHHTMLRIQGRMSEISELKIIRVSGQGLVNKIELPIGCKRLVPILGVHVCVV